VRKAYLLRSVARYLDDGSEVVDAAYMWQRHRLMIPFAAVSFIGVFLVAGLLGFDDLATQIVFGLAAVAVAVTATSDYRVLARTTKGLVLLRASRIRQVAAGEPRRLPPGTGVVPGGGTLLAVDWEVDGSIYTVPKSSEQAMRRIASDA
jgi:hypothetical protein